MRSEPEQPTRPEPGTPEPEWKSFERAVAAFLQSLEPGAHVEWNTRKPDAHTGRPRQRDVSVSARVAGIPVRIFVSCKDLSRKINELDVDHFNGEFISSRAHVGVLYSSSGFAQQAIEKARVLGITCCRLYQHEPPDVPEVLFFTTYLWRRRAQIIVTEGLDRHPDVLWRDLFNLVDKDGTLLDQLVSACATAAERAGSGIHEGKFRPDGLSIVNLTFEGMPTFGDFKLRLTHAWRLYRAKQNAHAVSGSYQATDGTFLGSIMSPAIDTWFADPGPGWEELPAIQDSIRPNAVHFIMPAGSARELLVDVLGPRVACPAGSTAPEATTRNE